MNASDFHIIINALFIGNTPTGIGRFTREVARAICRNQPLSRIVTPIPIDGIDRSQIISAPPFVRDDGKALHNACRLLYLNFAMPGTGHRDNNAVLYCPTPEMPFRPKIPAVIHIHDIHPILFREYSRKSTAILELFLKTAQKKAARICAPSRHVRDQLLDYWQGIAPPVDVVPNGVSTDFFCQSEPGSNTLLPEYVVSLKPFILFAGNIFPYKNIQTLTSAFTRVVSEIPHKLVIIGRDFSGRKAIPADPRIVHFDYVADDDLRAFYAAADMLVHPSKAEGFGLTVLEAMASGTPVIASNAAAIPEVAGDAAILLHPEDRDGFAKAMVELISNTALREDLISRGRKRAALFSWEKTAEGILESCKKAFNTR